MQLSQKRGRFFTCVVVLLITTLLTNTLAAFAMGPGYVRTGVMVGSLGGLVAEEFEGPSLVTLSTLAPGDAIQFAGNIWIVLDPATGYLLMQSAYGIDRSFSTEARADVYFNTVDSANIGYYLNDMEAADGFYQSMSEPDRDLVQSHLWTTGSEQNEADRTVNCKIGLISYSEYAMYKAYINTLDEPEHMPMWWTRTTQTSDSAWYVFVPPAGDDHLYEGSSTEGVCAVRPALYLNPGTVIAGGNGGWVAERANDLLSFNAVGQVGESEIDALAHTISFHMPYGSNLTAVQSDVSVSERATISPESGLSQDFTSSVEYSVTSEAGITQKWTVNCVVDQPTQVTLASLPAGSIIQFAGHTWIVLNPAIGYLLKQTAYGDPRPWTGDGGAVIFDGPDVWDYLNNQAAGFYQDPRFTLTNRSLIRSHQWTTGLDNDAANSMTCKVGLISNSEYLLYGPSGLNIISALPGGPFSEFDYRGNWWTRTIKPVGNSFVNQYGGVEEGGISASVRPTLYLDPTTLIANTPGGAVIHQAHEIDAFTVPNQASASIIDHANHTVTFRMPWGSNVTALQAAITISDGAAISPASGAAQDFSHPVSYVVTSQAGTPQTWTITCVVNELVPLSHLTAGDIVQFGGFTWIVLDPATGYLLKQYAYGPDKQLSAAPTAFAPLTPGNLGYYLNDLSAEGGFYQGLSAANRTLIQPHTWTVGTKTNEANSTVDCKVGLLSYSEYARYRGMNIINLLSDSDPDGSDNFNSWWTRTPDGYYWAWCVDTDGSLKSGVADTSYGTVRPALYLDSSILIDGGKGGAVTAQANGIRSFIVAGQVGTSTINPVNHMVTFHLPSGSGLDAIQPMIVASDGATLDPQSGTGRDFSHPITYTVTSAAGAVQVWTVNCVVDSDNATDIIEFTVPGQVGESVIDADHRTIVFRMPYGSNVTALNPTIEIAGASVEPKSADLVDFSNSVAQPVSYVVTAANGTQQTWSVTCKVAAAITSFRVDGQVGNAVINTQLSTVTFSMPYQSDVSSLLAAVEVSPGASIDRKPTDPVDFGSPVQYLVTEADGITEQTWIVTCRVNLNTATDIISFAVPGQVANSTAIDQNSHTVEFSMAYGTAVDALSPTFVLSEGATSSPASGATMDFRNHQFYTVTAADGSAQTWTAICNVNRNTATEIISFTVPAQVGSSTIDSELHAVSFIVPYGTNVMDLSPEITLSHGATAAITGSNPWEYVVTSEDGQHQQTWTITCFVKENTAADIISFAVPGQVPGSTAIDEDNLTIEFHVAYGTDIAALSPTLSLSAGATMNRKPEDAVDFRSPVEYNITSEDGDHPRTWTVTCVVDRNTAAEIISFSVPNQIAHSTVIDSENHTVTFRMIHGTDVSALEPVIGLSAEAAVSPISGSRVNFTDSETNPVSYTVTAASGLQQIWTVSCIVDKNTATDITSFGVPGQVAGSTNINSELHTVTFRMVYGTDIAALQPTIVLSAGATVNPASLAATSFNQPVTYTVTAENRTAEQDWMVTCIFEPNTATDITSFAVPSQVGRTQIDPLNHSVIFHMPYWANVRALRPTIGLSAGATVDRNLGDTVNFSSPAFYRVTAEDGSTEQSWLVRCIVDPDDSPPPFVLSKVSLPGINTDSASGITLNSATLHGSVSSSGGAICSLAEFRYRLVDGGYWQSTGSQIVSLSDGSSFSAGLAGLTPNAQYEFQARAFNTAGWGEGGTVSFTTTSAVLAKVDTIPASGLTLDGAIINGAIVNNGGAPVSERGFLWGVEGESHQRLAAGSSDSFDAALTGLKQNTTYCYQAYATNLAGTAYGPQLTFQTPGLVVSTLETTAISKNSVTLHGKVIGGGNSITSGGFAIFPDFTTVVPATLGADGTLSAVVNGLKPGTIYYVQAFVDGASGRLYASSSSSFTTLKDLPIVETRLPIAITAIGASMVGYISRNNGLAITESGFLWGVDAQPSTRLSATTGADGRTFTQALKDLKRATTYYYQAYAVNSQGTGYGQVQSFTSLATLPQVTTARPVSDGINISRAALTGEIVENGGCITEYGFMYRLRSNANWQKLVAGSEPQLGAFSATLNAPEPPNYSSYYLVRAYAQNSGGIGYGETYSIPRIPSVRSILDNATITGTSAKLQGNTFIMTEGTNATTRGFQYRLVGGEWINVGMEQGDFGNNTGFRFDLTDLKPAAKYEFRAMAQNVAGWGYGETIGFNTSYGRTDKEAAVNMKAAGYSVGAIANVLKTVFLDTIDATILALQFAEYGAVEIAGGLRASRYYDSLGGYYSAIYVAGRLKSTGGYDSVTLATILQQTFASEMRWGIYSWRPEWETAEVLKRLGYSDDETFLALKDVCKYNVPAAAAALMRQGQSSLQAISTAVAHVYGVDELAAWLWHGPYPSFTISSPGDTKAFVYNMQRAGIDSLQIARALQIEKPTLTSDECALLFMSNSYGVPETATILEQIFAADIPTVAASIRRTNYQLAPLENWLVNIAKVTPWELALIMTDNSWPDKSSAVPAALLQYYQLSGLELTKTLYAAGWTEANYGYGPKNDGCGLRTVISVLVKDLHLSTTGEMIGVLREIGFSPLGVAQMMGYSFTLFGASDKSYFLPAYEQQGYSATDAALWILDAYAVHNFEANDVIDWLQRFSTYDLKETLLAIRNIYQMDAAKMLQYVINNNRNFRWGWSDGEIAEAVTEIYGVDPYLAVCQAMKSAGAPAVQTAGTIKGLLKTNEMRPVAEYLAKVGYTQKEVLYALAAVFDPGTRDRMAIIFGMLSALWKELYPDHTEDMQELLSASGVTKASEAITALQAAGYPLDDVVLCLRDIYGSSIVKAIELLTKSGYYQPSEILASVAKIYDADPILARIQAIHDAGSPAQEVVYVLKKEFGITASVTVVGYLDQVGYSQMEALGTQVDIYRPSVNAFLFVTQLVETVYPEEENSLKLALALFGAVSPAEANKVFNNTQGYTQVDSARTLKEVFGCTAAEVAGLLRDYWLETDILLVLKQVFPDVDPLVALVLGQKLKWNEGLGASRGRFEYLGVTDPVKLFQYLRDTSYADDDILADMVGVSRYRDSIYLILKAYYGAADMLTMAQLFRNNPLLIPYYALGTYPGDVPAQLLAAFPGKNTANVALAVKQAGFIVDKYSTTPPAPEIDITAWLRGLSRQEQRNDALAAILGPKNLGLRVLYAREILQFEGYTPLEIGNWLKKNDYSLPDILEGLVLVFGEPIVGGAHQPLRTMQAMGYGIDDLFRAEVGLYHRTYPTDHIEYFWALSDMFDLGYSFEEVTHAYVRTGGPLDDLPQALWDISVTYFNNYATHGAAIATGLYNYHHLSAVHVANYAYDAMRGNASLVDLAKGFLACGDGVYYQSEVLQAMKSVGGKYLQAVLAKDGVPFGGGELTDGSGLRILHDAGLSADDAASTMRDDGQGWMEALSIMIQAGYSGGDSISALWNNSSYHNAMGADIIQLMSSAGQMAVDPGMFKALKILGTLSYYGYKMGNAGR